MSAAGSTRLLTAAAFGCLLFAGGFSAALDLPSPVEPVPAVDTANSPQQTELPSCVFSDKEKISGYVKKSVDAANSSIDLALYGFGLPELYDALLAAADRGVQIRFILNQAQAFGPKDDKLYTQLNTLKEHGAQIKSLKGYGKYGIMHNKIGIYDNAVASAGSYNWTAGADSDNYENALFLKNPEEVSGFLKYYDWMWQHSRPLEDGELADELPPGAYGEPPAGEPEIEFNGAKFPRYAFSPLGGVENRIIEAIKASKEQICVAVYSFYSDTIYQALAEAKTRGVNIKVVVDRVQAVNSPVTKLMIQNGFDFKWSKGLKGGGFMHHKFSVFDDKLLFSGSFNWSGKAENDNFENAVFLTDAETVSAFAAECEQLHSQAYAPALEDLNKIDEEVKQQAQPKDR